MDDNALSNPVDVENILTLRRQFYNQKQIAAIVRVSQSTVSRVLRREEARDWARIVRHKAAAKACQFRRLEWMAEKVCGLRLFPDSDGKMNLGLGDVGGALLVLRATRRVGEAKLEDGE